MRNVKACVSDPNKFVSDPGSRIKVLYSSKVTPSGEILLKPSGKEDIQDYINSFRESTDMSFILHQLALGNTSVLQRDQMVFGDFTEMPTTLADAQQRLIDGEAAFMQLPLDVRQQFDNNFRNWLFSSGSPEWIEKMGNLVPKTEEAIEVPSDPVVKEEI